MRMSACFIVRVTACAFLLVSGFESESQPFETAGALTSCSPDIISSGSRSTESISRLASLSVGEGALFGAPEWPLGVTKLLNSSRPSPDFIVVDLPGGPGGAAGSPLASMIQKRKYADKALVFGISYSGSEWNDEKFEERLRKEKLPALQCDGEVLGQLIEEIRNYFTDIPIVLQASSFGAVPGLLASSSLSEEDFLILLSPWTHHQPAEFVFSGKYSVFGSNGSVTGSSVPQAQIDHWRRGMLDGLGIDETLPSDPSRDWMNRSLDAVRVSKAKTLVVMGEWETRNDLKIAENYFRSHISNLKFIVLQKAFHESAPVDTRTVEELRRFIGFELPDQ
jgi:hypothetical protein